jgi:hypothetical protein
MSNSRTVLESNDELERTKSVKDLSFNEFPSEGDLGVHWDVETDSLGFRINTLACKPTRRGIIYLVSSVYDPLGLAAPFVLSAKIIWQEACRQRLNWDQELPGKELSQCYQWLNDLPKLSTFLVSRCLKPTFSGKIVDTQLHHFSDACESGYGITSYIRFMNDQDRIHCTMVIIRSRVAPLKKMTIPRLELTAAVRMSLKIRSI